MPRTTYIFRDMIRQGREKKLIPAKSREAIDWYRQTARKADRIKTHTLLKNNPSKLSEALLPGNMMLFSYDPKHKKTLPYYDMFPLIFPIETYKDGFLGMNFHYLPYQLRGYLMDALYGTVNNKRYDATTKLNISYGILASAAKYKWFRPTVKRYLYQHVRSRFLVVNAQEWDIALFMPLAKFTGANIQKIWSDSRKKIK